MRSCYSRLDQKELDAAMQDFPPLDTEYCERVTNALFRPILFVKDGKGEREISCSSCRRTEKLAVPARTMDSAAVKLLYGKHRERARCPWCGTEAEIRERRYVKEGVALEEFSAVVFLQEAGGVLYAQGFWATKRYRGDMSAQQLCAAPLFMETAAYRFRLGCAEAYTRDENSEKYYCQRVKGNYSRQNWIREPFTNDSWHPMGLQYEPYRVFGWDALARSELKYCQYDLFRMGFKRSRIEENGIHVDLMKYLTVYTQWPQQVERLMKAGWEVLVLDLVAARKKNAAIIKWDEPDLRKAIGLNGQELKAWRDSGSSLYRIGDYKALRKVGIPASFEEIEQMHRSLSFEYETAIKYCKKYGIRPGRLTRYIEERSGRNKEYYLATAAISYWKDYVDTCEKLGYDLRNETVLLPKRLGAKHDEAAAELNKRKLRLAKEQEAQEKLAAADRLKKWRKRYAAEIDGFIFRPAESSLEIVDEGKALQHCVGGYAERHMAGKLTICFVRRVENPEASLYTVEMHGAELIQIHGFKNERFQGAKDPRKVLGRRLDAWLAWVAGGSKRDKQGKPVLPKTEKQKEVKIA